MNHQGMSRQGMSHQYDALWLSVSPQLQRFDQRLLQCLLKVTTVRQWSYRQTADEPCSMETCLVLLHDYLKQQERPMHLLGHGISGIVGLLYARRHPERVASLTLLSVGANPSVSWHSHYYALRNLLPCKRSMVLVQMARLLCGPYCPSVLQTVAGMLEKDLDECLALHSLASRTVVQYDPIKPPLLVCQGKLDVILDPNTQLRWDKYLKDGETPNGVTVSQRFWQCPEGRHFFHYDYPQLVADEIITYWQDIYEYASLLAQAA